MKKLRLLVLLLVAALVFAGASEANARKKTKRAKPKTTVTTPQPRTATSVKRDKQQTQKEITDTKRRIDKNARETRRTLDRLEDLNGRISTQEREINRLQADINQTESQITVLSDSLTVMRGQTDALRADLAVTLRQMRARRRGVNDLSFVFAAPNFSAALRRVQYIRQLNAWRAGKIARLREQIAETDTLRNQLDNVRNRHATLLTTVSAERQTLAERRNQQQQTVRKLRGESKELNALLVRKQKRARELDRELDRIIAEEARRAEAARKAEAARREEAARKAEAERRKKEAAAQASPSQAPAAEAPAPEAKPTKPAPTTHTADADRQITGSFAANKGRLLFPVAGKYTIVGNFGHGHHKDISNIEVNNSGIDISVAPGTKARAVFGGTVSSVFLMPGYNNIVILRHGEYLTVYAGLTGLAVKKGQTVKTGATLGTVATDAADDNRTVLHFEVRRERAKLNPLEWVR